MRRCVYVGAVHGFRAIYRSVYAGVVASKFCAGMDYAENDRQETQSCCARPSCKGHVNTITIEITIPGNWLHPLPRREIVQGGSGFDHIANKCSLRQVELFKLTDGGLFALIQRCTKEALARSLPMSTRYPDRHPDPAYGLQPLLVTVPREWMKPKVIPAANWGEVMVLESRITGFRSG